MILARTFKYLSYLGGVIVLLFIVLGWVQTALFFTYFKVFTFSIVFSYTFFTGYIFLSRCDWHSALKLLTSVLIFIPLVVHGLAFFDPVLLEESWPLLIGFLVLQSGINMYSALGYFSSNVRLSRMDYLLLFLIAITLLPILLIFLINIAEVYFYSFMLPSVVVLFIVILIAMVSKGRKRIDK